MSVVSRLKTKGSFKLDLSANLAGTGWSAAVQFVCIPFYIKFLGVEGYGLIGFYVMMVAMLQVLDLGVTPTINRELARYSVRPDLAAEARDLVRTIEVGYWAIGVLLGLVVMAAAPFLAAHWIHAANLPADRVRHAVAAMGLLIVFQWPGVFYNAGLIGLHRQVLANAVKIVMSTVGSAVALLVLWLVSPTAQAFFLSQAAVAAINAVILIACLWHVMPPAERRPRIHLRLLRGVWRFAAAMSGITISSVILTQLDKLILSRICTLDVFGYYTVAGSFGRVLLMIGGPVFDAIFPRFSALVAAHDERNLEELYHRASQVMSVLIVPLAAILAFFAPEILLLWTRNPDIARNAATIARLLSVAAAINAVLILPYTLQLAHGWTSLGLKMNIGMVIAMAPAIWLLATHYGAIGGAAAYLALITVSIVIQVPLTHRRLLKGEAGHWFMRDVGIIAVAVLLVAGLGRLLVSASAAPLIAAISLVIVLAAAVAAGAFSASEVRSWVMDQLTKARPAYT